MKSVISDNIHYIYFITFNIRAFFFLNVPCLNLGASNTPTRHIYCQIRQFLFDPWIKLYQLLPLRVRVNLTEKSDVTIYYIRLTTRLEPHDLM